MTKQAQLAAGVEKKRLVAAKHLPGAAHMTATEGSINLDANLNYRHGPFNCDLHHEGIHTRYNDYAYSKFIKRLLLGTTFLLAPALIKKKLNPQGIKRIVYPTIMTGTFYTGFQYDGWLIPYRERRADIEGHYATQCYHCVFDKADELHNTITQVHQAITALQHDPSLVINPEINAQDVLKQLQEYVWERSRYLSPEELETIGHRLKKEKKICDYHHNNPDARPDEICDIPTQDPATN